jgi:hypothetical protein
MSYFLRHLKHCRFLVIATLLTLPGDLLGQSTTIREVRPIGMHFQIFGPAAFGFAFDYHLSNNVDLDFALGLLGQQFGVKYHPIASGSNEFLSSLYLGIVGEYVQELSIFGGNSENTLGFYVPVGFEVFAYEGLTLTAEGGYNHTEKDFGQVNTNQFNFAFRVGYHLLQSQNSIK